MEGRSLELGAQKASRGEHTLRPDAKCKDLKVKDVPQKALDNDPAMYYYYSVRDSAAPRCLGLPSGREPKKLHSGLGS